MSGCQANILRDLAAAKALFQQRTIVAILRDGADQEPVRGCTGKRSFATHLQASHHAKWMRRKYDTRVAEYHCAACRSWHIGGTDD